MNHRLGQPTKQTFSSLSSRPNSVEQDRFRKENVVECSYRACVQRNKPSQECRKVHISTVTFLYDGGPLVASSCFLSTVGTTAAAAASEKGTTCAPSITLHGLKWPQLTEAPSVFFSCTCICTGHCGVSPPSFLGPSSLKTIMKTSQLNQDQSSFSGPLRSNCISVTFL